MSKNQPKGTAQHTFMWVDFFGQFYHLHTFIYYWFWKISTLYWIKTHICYTLKNILNLENLKNIGVTNWSKNIDLSNKAIFAVYWGVYSAGHCEGFCHVGCVRVTFSFQTLSRNTQQASMEKRSHTALWSLLALNCVQCAIMILKSQEPRFKILIAVKTTGS